MNCVKIHTNWGGRRVPRVNRMDWADKIEGEDVTADSLEPAGRTGTPVEITGARPGK